MYQGDNTIFYSLLILGFLQLLLSLESVRSGLRFYNYVGDRLRKPVSEFVGFVTVFVPCRGLDQGFEKNIRALFAQTRGDFEIVFAVDDSSDPVVPVLEQFIGNKDNAKIVVAGKASDSGQKVHNLSVAVLEARDDSVAFVFLDSDACPSETWLADLLAPLNEGSNVCTSGYRWFLPDKGGLATHILSAWNASIASALGPDRTSNFCWGGSTAIRRSVFDELDVPKRWKGTVSDDFVLTNELRKAGHGIHFEPRCLTATIEDTTISEMFEFTTRQMKITKTYSRRHFVVSFIGAALFVVSALLAAAALVFGDESVFLPALVFLVLIWSLGTAKSVIRLKAVEKCLPSYSTKLNRQYFWQILLWPVSTFIFLVNDIAACMSNHISWRGIHYELVSDKEMRILES